LAEIDVVAALEMTTGDAIVDAKIRALNNLHSQKVRALMKSVNALKDQLSLQRAQAKEHRRSSLIGGLRDKVRAQELVADVLKGELQTRGRMSAEEVNQFVIKRTLGGPKRFRPKSREELQNEQIGLEKKMRKLMEKNKKLELQIAEGGVDGKGGENSNTMNRRNHHGSNSQFPLPPSPVPSTPPYATGGHANADSGLQGQVSELLDEVESLKVAVRSRDTNLAAQMQEMDRLRSENRELRRIEERLAHKERKHRDLKEKNAGMSRENARLQEEAEAARADLVQVKASLDTAKEEAKIETDALRSQYGRQMDELASSMSREAELVEQLERFKGEATASRQNNYELVRNKDITLSETQKQNSELKSSIQSITLKNEKLEREIASLQDGNKEGAVTKEKLRNEAQRSRELQRRIKDLETRLEDNMSRREQAEAAVTTLQERAKAAESQNSKLHRELEALTNRVSMEEAMLESAEKDKESIRVASMNEEKVKDMQTTIADLESELKMKKGEVGELTKEVSSLMGDKEGLDQVVSGLKDKLEQAEKTRDFALKSAKLASQASSASKSEEDSKVVGELIVQKSKFEEMFKESEEKREALEKEAVKLKEAVKALKQKIDAAQILKKKQMLALEKAQAELKSAKSNSGSSKDVEELKVLLRGAEIERDTSEGKIGNLEREVKQLRKRVASGEKKIGSAKERFALKVRELEKEIKGDGKSEFTTLRKQLEELNLENTKIQKESNGKIKSIQTDLDAHVDAVALLREMGEKYRSYAGVLVETLTAHNLSEAIPSMPEMSSHVQEHQRSMEESLSDSESDASSLSTQGTR